MASATVLARGIYRFAAAPTKVAAHAHYAIVRVPRLLTQRGVTVSGEKDRAGFDRFIAVDAWQMARKTQDSGHGGQEVCDDPSPHSPPKRRVLLAKLLSEADPKWLIEPARSGSSGRPEVAYRAGPKWLIGPARSGVSGRLEVAYRAGPKRLIEPALIVEALKTFRVYRTLEFYGPLLDDTRRMAPLTREDAVRLRAHAKNVGGKVAVKPAGKACFASPLPAPAPAPGPAPGPGPVMYDKRCLKLLG